MTLYHDIMNSDHKRVTRKILEQTKRNHKNTMISKAKNIESMNKSKWKKQVKEKIGKSIEERAKEEIINKTTARAIVKDKWERKKYLQKCDSD